LRPRKFAGFKNGEEKRQFKACCETFSGSKPLKRGRRQQEGAKKRNAGSKDIQVGTYHTLGIAPEKTSICRV